MSIEEFAENVRKEMEGKADGTVTVREVIKNNGIKLHGLLITEQESNIAPTIYLEPYYSDYEKGKSMERIIGNILDTYEKVKMRYRIDLTWFTDYEQVRNRIFYKLINREANEEILKEIPYEPYLDLAKVYYVKADTKELGDGNIQVYHNHLQNWGITEEELKTVAEKNTEKFLPAMIKDMVNIVETIFQEAGEEDSGEDEATALCDCLHGKMYVASNIRNCNGAAVMCYTDALKDFAEQKKSDLFILPSSIHEVILIPVVNGDDVDRLREIVHEVNRNHMEPIEVLSDNMYYYRRSENEIVIV
ncbi:MAG: DUF5688 family protein [Acetatifactor sp.]